MKIQNDKDKDGDKVKETVEEQDVFAAAGDVVLAVSATTSVSLMRLHANDDFLYMRHSF